MAIFPERNSSCHFRPTRAVSRMREAAHRVESRGIEWPGCARRQAADESRGPRTRSLVDPLGDHRHGRELAARGREPPRRRFSDDGRGRSAALQYFNATGHFSSSGPHRPPLVTCWSRRGRRLPSGLLRGDEPGRGGDRKCRRSRLGPGVRGLLRMGLGASAARTRLGCLHDDRDRWHRPGLLALGGSARGDRPEASVVSGVILGLVAGIAIALYTYAASRAITSGYLRVG